MRFIPRFGDSPMARKVKPTDWQAKVKGLLKAELTCCAFRICTCVSCSRRSTITASCASSSLHVGTAGEREPVLAAAGDDTMAAPVGSSTAGLVTLLRPPTRCILWQRPERWNLIILAGSHRAYACPAPHTRKVHRKEGQLVEASRMRIVDRVSD